MALDFTGERFVPKLRGQIYYEHMHRYAIALRFVSGKRVLDIASGEGYGSNLLAGVAAHVVGVDIDQESVDHARKRYYVPNLHFVRGSCEQIPLDAGSVDVVVSFETIEHVDDHRRMLDEIRRVLVPDGSLIISSPNKLVYSDIPGNRNPFHVQELYYSELRDELSSRFSQVTIYGQRIAASSLVFPLRGSSRASSMWFSGNLTEVDERFPELPDPVYFLAMCGPNADNLTDLSSAFVDTDDDLLHDMQQEVLTMRHQATNGLAQHEPELALPAQRLSLPGTPQASADEAGESQAAHFKRDALDELLRTFGSVTSVLQVADFVMPDANDDDITIAKSLTAELLKVRTRAAELQQIVAGYEEERHSDQLLTARRTSELEGALAAEQQAISALRDQASAWQAERLRLMQAHLLEMRSVEQDAVARCAAEIRRLESDVEGWRLRYEGQSIRVEDDAKAKPLHSSDEVLQLTRERELLQSMLRSNSWRLTKPLRLALAKVRSKNGSSL